jgi:hypothetical protein
MIMEIAERCEPISFWLPTQEWQLIYDNPFVYEIPNLTVRLSSREVDEHRIPNLPSSGVHTIKSKVPRSYIWCQADYNGGQCGRCRMCWDPELNISYKLKEK